MFSLSTRVAAGLFFASVSLQSMASEIRLNDWAFNIDGSVYDFFAGDPLPGSGSFDNLTGLGSLDFQFSSPGTHSLIAFFNHEFAAGHNTFFNEYGEAKGAPANGQSWQIDEPGLVFGTIYDNMLAGELANTNYIPASSPEDVSLALGWDFELQAGEQALLSLMIGQQEPDADFYLSHSDPEMGPGFDEQASLYFWGDLTITGGPVPVSGPTSLSILSLGLLALVWRRRASLPGTARC